MTIVDEGGKVQTWTAVYWHFYVRFEYEAEDFAEAYDYLRNGERAGTLSGDSIIGPDGKVVMDSEAFTEASCSGWTAEDAYVYATTQREPGGEAST